MLAPVSISRLQFAELSVCLLVLLSVTITDFEQGRIPDVIRVPAQALTIVDGFAQPGFD